MSEAKVNAREDYSVIKVRSFRGHDGDGFNATLAYKGKAIAEVDDDAWGGEYRFNWLGYRPNETGAEEAAFDAMLDSLPLDFSSKLFPNGHKLDRDCFVYPLIIKFDNLKKMRRKIKSTVLFQSEANGPLSYYTKMKPTAEKIAWVKEKNPKAIILNELPENEAYEIWINS